MPVLRALRFTVVSYSTIDSIESLKILDCLNYGYIYSTEFHAKWQ